MTEEMYICDECKGTGKRDNKNDQMKSTKSFTIQKHDITCRKCNGSGKLNWLERIFGKNQKIPIFVNTKEELLEHFGSDAQFKRPGYYI